MKKYQTEFKLEVVKSFLAGEGGAKLLARQWSVPRGEDPHLGEPLSAAMERSRSPLPHAKEVLAAYYHEHGIMPSVQRLAELLGVSSTSSAHYVVQKLRNEGYLAANEFGKLTPGPQFHKAPSRPSIPAELLQVLPAGEELKVIQVDENWKLDDSVWQGDLLVLAPLDQVELSDLLVLRRGNTFVLANEPRPGWRPQGVVVGQYRPHGRALSPTARP